MASFEGAYSSILQGVSQQIPRMRLPGQVSAQINMLSDPVTNVRRRPGAEFVYSLDLPGSTNTSIKAWDVDIGGQQVHVILCVNSGTILLLDQEFNLLDTLQDDYLIAPNTQSVKAASVGTEMYFANVGEAPVLGAGTNTSPAPSRRGFAFVTAGTFSKAYNLTVETNAGSLVGTYTTPDASASGAAANSTPDKIAEELVDSLIALGIVGTLNVTPYRDGPFIYFEGTGAVTSLVVSSSSGSVYITVSGASTVRTEAGLPARLPEEADGYVVAVGQQKLLIYYTYNHATVSWLESGDYASPGNITNMPLSLRYDTGTTTWELATTPFEGRVAGDDETNPVPDFTASGITGIGSYQGRLVLLMGSQVLLSSSRNPRRLMRSTVTGLLDADPIAVGASSNSSAKYEYAVPFQKDLLLFSARYQALIPGGNQAITPRTATVLVTSTFSADMHTDPLPIGRTLLYPTPLSADFFGILEMISSQYTDSQYISNLSTSHLPKYMAGTCRFGASSSVASTVCFGQSLDMQGVLIYQYLWSGDEQIQQAWHRWQFAYGVATSYFTGEVLNFVFAQNDKIIGARVDPKVGVVSSGGSRRPYLDLYFEAEVVDNLFTLPAWVIAFDPDFGDKIKLSQTTGELAGEEVGVVSVDSGTGVVETVRSFPSGTVSVGVPFRALLQPTPPQMQDRNGQKIDSNKLTVLRFGLNTQNSAEFRVSVADSTGLDSDLSQGTLRWSSRELDLGEARVAEYSRAIVPARTDADTTVFQIYTEGLGELNVVGIDYTCRYNQKVRRR